MVTKSIPDIVADESVRRLIEKAQQDIRDGQAIYAVPGCLREIVEPLVPVIVAMVRLALSAKWN